MLDPSLKGIFLHITEHYILRLYVSVNDPLGMSVVDRIADLNKNSNVAASHPPVFTPEFVFRSRRSSFQDIPSTLFMMSIENHRWFVQVHGLVRHWDVRVS